VRMVNPTALNFLNTIKSGDGGLIELLTNGDALLRWMVEALVLSEEESAAIRASIKDEDFDQIALDAKWLREWFRAFATKHMGQPVCADALAALAPLNEILHNARASVAINLRPAPGSECARLEVRRHRDWADPRSVLCVLVEEVAVAICETDFSLIKKCAGPGCGMVFLDCSRTHKRRWCTMSNCGNKAKQAAHRERAKKSSSLVPRN